jgi:hypothetical protein
MGLEKQLRQYAEWRILLAANSLSLTTEDEIDSTDIDNVGQWSIQIDLRKDLWKYVEITASSIKEWKNTFINKVLILFYFINKCMFFSSLIFVVHKKKLNVGSKLLKILKRKYPKMIQLFFIG